MPAPSEPERPAVLGVELTAKGRGLLGKATVVFEEELQARLGDVLPERSLEQLRQTLTTLRSAGRSRRRP